MMSGDRKNFDMQSNCSAEVVSDNPNDLLGRIGRQSSSDHQKIKHGQAALLFGDAIHRNEVEIMREIIPSLDLMVVMELLQGNSYDLERSLDAALALMASLAAEDGRAVLTDSYSVTGNNWKEPITSTSQASLRMNRHSTKEDFLPPTPYRARSSSSLPSVLDLEPGIRPNAKNVAKESGSSSSVFVKDHEVNINHTFTRNINPHILQNSKQNLKEFRGVPMLLSERFLAAPRFRIVINKHTNASTDFTIYFRRKTEKIGITIQELDSEIRIHTLHAKSPSEPLLALESGIKINDILTGINFEYFCPGAEVQDIIDILHLTGTFITLHFSRRYIPDDIQVQSYLSPHHKFARMLLDQTVIPEGKASIVSTAVRRLKERSLSWDSNVISQRIKAWKLDAFLIPKHKASGTLTFDRTSHSNSGVTVPGSGSSIGSSSSGSSHSRTSRRASGDFPVRTHTDTSSSTDPVCLLRPAISVRIIRAEERPDHVVYVIWVMDVRSGAEWFVRRRFREFHDFKDILTGIRAGLSRIDFPSKRLNVAEIGAMVAERLSLLQKFLRKICGLICINSLHPSTLKIHLALQQFLAVTDRMENILFLESKPTFLSGKYMVQMFVHSILQMSVMDKVQSGFIETFFENSRLDDNKIWNQKEGRKLLNSMKDYTDNLETILFEAIIEDCYDIFKKFSVDAVGGCIKSIKDGTKKSNLNSSNRLHTGEGHVTRISDTNNCKDGTNFKSSDDVSSESNSENYRQSRSTNPSNLATSNHAFHFSTPADCNNHNSAETFANVTSKERICLKSEVHSYAIDQGIEEDDSGSISNSSREKDLIHDEARKEGRKKDYQQLQHQRDEDEMRIHIRSAIRRQVEIEIFVPCSARLHAVLDRSFSGDEAALRKNVAQIAHKPQSFFGIPLQQTSPTNWDAIVFQMREIRSKSLPHDRLEALLLTAKEIPLLFSKEHPVNPKDRNNSVTLGADDFLPIFIYILARAQIPNLFALTEELQAMCDPDKRMSETGYYLATLEASLQHVIEANVTMESQVLFPEILRSKVGSDSDSDCDSDSRSDSNSDSGSDEYTEHEREESNDIIVVHPVI